MQQRKLIILLMLLVLLPLSLLAWQGWRISQDTQKLNDARFASLMTARLNQVDTVVQSYFEEMQLKWSLSIPQWELDSESTRKRINNDGNIRQIFVLDPQRIRSFPPQDADITAAEKVFVDRLASVLKDPQILFSSQSDDADLEQADGIRKRLDKDSIIASVPRSKESTLSSFSEESSQSSAVEEMAIIEPSANIAASDSIALNSSLEQSIAKPKIAKKARKTQSYLDAKPSAQTSLLDANKQGWYMWHWGNDANLIFWQEGKDNSIVGVEMEPIRVKADLISRLPDTVPGENLDFRLRLLDTAAKVVYQWGNYEIIESQNKPQQRLGLSYPLSSWMLEYYGDPFNQKGFSRFNLFLSLLAFALLLAGLAWFLYREQTREMRLAEKRVQFVSQVSHELKTPLTNIRMYAEMLESQVDDAEQPQRYLQVITDESKRLTRMISNVLNFSREPRIHKREIDADAVIRQSIEHFQPSFKAKNLVVNADLKMDGLLNTDPDLLEQILNNLLSNVEKYAADGKRLDINSELINESYVVTIRDYGLGISKMERKQIFKPFYRIDDKITEGVSGTGIGLTIARQQAEYLGGSLEYADVKEGACFELKLPLGEV